jgi:trans-AT polyketide synthase/acyltransferase/oxidoreductase domain-containing protein
MITYVFPGQGSQFKGMGANFFDKFTEFTDKVDEILGYSIKDLCLNDPERKLNQTQFTQPALYTVNALSYLKKLEQTGRRPDYVAGHSLGEYNALFAAGAFDFETGLRLVKTRGELMGKASGGGMAAVVGLNGEQVAAVLKRNNLSTIEIANYNTPTQMVIAGPQQDIDQAFSCFERENAIYIPLNVSGAFHTSCMNSSRELYRKHVDALEFLPLRIPVISNVQARPYRQEEIKSNLIEQITHSVRWTDSIRYLIGRGVMDFEEIGPGEVLTKLIQAIKRHAGPLVVASAEAAIRAEEAEKPAAEAAAACYGDQQSDSLREQLPVLPGITASSLGDAGFKRDYNLAYAYLTGGMYRGVASKEMVTRMGKAGMMGFFGTAGLGLDQVSAAIEQIQKELAQGQPYGMNLVHNLCEPELEEKTIDLFLAHGVRNIEAAAFLSITPALVRYHAQGLARGEDGKVSSRNRIIAKVSRPEVAEAFLSPAPERILGKLLEDGKITPEEAELSREIPVADDLCVEADSGGHTDGGVAYCLMPVMLRLRDEMMARHHYQSRVRVGAAGGIGAPESAAAAFILGADFVLTGSINQCTVEAATSDAVKDLLQQINVQDTEYAPAGDMFELGARVQVLKKGLFFPARANKLYELYRRYDSLSEIDENTRKQIQERYFKKSFEEIYFDLKSYYPAREIAEAERNPKHRMALIFRWYFGYSAQLALSGSEEAKVDYQVHCGPALGAFNQWVKGTRLEDWRNRHVDEIAVKLLKETAELLNQRYSALLKAGGPRQDNLLGVEI